MKNTWYLFLFTILFACTPKEEKKADPSTSQRVEEKVLEYYPDGKKKVEGTKVNGEKHGLWRFYYKNGFLWSEGKFWYGDRTGYSTVFYDNGKKQMEGEYEDDKKVGKWKLWNKDGSLKQTIDMDSLQSRHDSLNASLNQ